MIYIPRLAEKIIQEFIKTPKVIIVLGARQVGKTTLIERIVGKQTGIIFNLDIAVDKARLLAVSNLSPFDAIKNLGNPSVIVIDEAQRLPEASTIVKGWYDQHIPSKIILLGSSSLNLLDQTAEALTGRNEKLYLPPLLFSEIVQNQTWYSDNIDINIIKKSFIPQINSLFMQALIYGSYPETITSNNKERYLLNLTSDYLLKDVLQLGFIKSDEIIKKLLMLLAYQIGSEASVNELASNLGIARNTVERYLDLLEKTFVIFRLHAFSTNLRKEIVKNTKIFFWDTGVRNALLKEFSLSEYRADIGHLFENWIIAEFAKKNMLEGNLYNMYFWRTTDNSEVDLVIKGNNIFKAYEIKWKNQKAVSKSFENRYDIPIEVIAKETILNFSSIITN